MAEKTVSQECYRMMPICLLFYRESFFEKHQVQSSLGCSYHSQMFCPWLSREQMNWIPFTQIRQLNSNQLRYDKLFVDNKLYVWSEVQGRVVEQVDLKSYKS